MYFASQDHRATVRCFLDFHEIKGPVLDIACLVLSVASDDDDDNNQ